MGRPHPALLVVARGGDVGKVEDSERVLASAIEHKMVGLLRVAVDESRIHVGSAVEAVLARRTLRTAAHNAALWEEIERIATTFGSAGIEFGVFKGVTTEVRWYPRQGIRPASDIDIFIAPHHGARFGEAVRLLAPGHVLGDVIQDYADANLIQSTDVELPSGIWIDVHTDPLKTGLPARSLEEIWQRRQRLVAPAGAELAVLDPATALVQSLLHLQKDRYSYLLGFADIARIIASQDVDWRAVHELAAAEGIAIHIEESLRIVSETLQLDIPVPEARPTAFLWARLWPPPSRLQGDTGISRKVRTRYWIPFTIRRRRAEALRWWLRLIFPPKRLFAYFHPQVTGPYLWRLISLRSGLAWRRHQRNAAQRASGQASSGFARPRLSRDAGGSRRA